MADLTLAEFHTLVSEALGRGTALDSLIPQRTKMAARWIENAYTFQYMKTWREFTVDITATYPHIVNLDGLIIKRIRSIRRVTTGTDGSILYSRPWLKLNPEDRESRPSTEVESYWLNGRSSIILNAVPTEDITCQANLVELTSWSTDTSSTHWLLENATQLLLMRTLMMMMSRTRDPKTWDMWRQEFEMEQTALDISESDIQESDDTLVWEPPHYAQFDDTLRSNS